MFKIVPTHRKILTKEGTTEGNEEERNLDSSKYVCRLGVVKLIIIALSITIAAIIHITLSLVQKRIISDRIQIIYNSYR